MSSTDKAPLTYLYLPEYGYVVYRDIFDRDKCLEKKGVLAHKVASFVCEEDAKFYINQRADGWIPVSERLPEIGDNQYAFPVVHEKKGQTYAIWNGEQKKWLHIDYPHYITHWYDLPAPPEGE